LGLSPPAPLSQLLSIGFDIEIKEAPEENDDEALEEDDEKKEKDL
jgi:hypothetical protein